MKKLIIALAFMILFSGSFLYKPSTTFACSCLQPPPVEVELERKTAIFSGKVIKIEDTTTFNQSSGDLLKVIFEVKSSWKGINQPQAIVYTTRDSASCGFNFNLNEDYVVYAYSEEDKLMTGLCERTKSLDIAQEDLKALGEGKEPSKDLDFFKESTKEQNNNTYYGTIALIIIAILGIVFLIYKRVKGK
ncbi:hypothetical protein PY093_17980 [Cytobacillus sp. S13-E01]|uniref:hypothetical protein n=1 Tax=Cytobacillus sp. S13-E01 TaxID=3031326 RepID=UPI0023D82EA9|nr:hypothetical protein [Cytobacillus sp. S13-E01]MDF0728527.1 hypothetical protein [Cytobacillus sp. S13-E01]